MGTHRRAPLSILVGALVTLLGSPGVVGAELPSPAHTYQITARVDLDRHLVTGQVEIRFRNTSRAPLNELAFHLYANAFEHDRTRFALEGGWKVRGRQLSDPGSIHVQAVRVEGQPADRPMETDLLPSDRTQGRLRLDQRLSPGQSLTIGLDFETKLPAAVARMGYARDFHLLGQWFPKLAKLEIDGHFAGFPYHGLGEFYADFADYDLTIDVPDGASSLCNGRRLSPGRTTNGRRVEHYRAAAVHDVACAVTTHARRTRRDVQGVLVEVMSPPGYEAAVARQLAVIGDGIRYLSRRFGGYPYDTLAVVIPPRYAHAVMGMEYPGLIVTGGPWWSLPVAGIDIAHDVVTAHELAHQWFYGLLASNEQAFPFLDEGLTEWVSWDALDHRMRDKGDLNPRSILDVLGKLSDRRTGISSLEPAHAYLPRDLAWAAYFQPAMALEGLAERFGRTRIHRTLGRYARKHRFGHPTPEDLMAAFDAEFGDGFAAREVTPMLTGQTPVTAAAHRRTTSGPSAGDRSNWFSMLLFTLQSLLAVLGP